MTSPEKQAVLSGDFQSAPVDPEHNRYPFCIVWCPLPVISLFIPFIGHLGIADSKGLKQSHSFFFDQTDMRNSILVSYLISLAPIT